MCPKDSDGAWFPEEDTIEIRFQPGLLGALVSFLSLVSPCFPGRRAGTVSAGDLAVR